MASRVSSYFPKGGHSATETLKTMHLIALTLLSRSRRGGVVILMVLRSWGHMFDPPLIPSFGGDFNQDPMIIGKDKRKIRAHCDAGDYTVPNVLSPRDPTYRT